MPGRRSLRPVSSGRWLSTTVAHRMRRSSAVASACQRARGCLGAVRARVTRDVEMERGYQQLLKFMVTTGLLLLALLAQKGFNDSKSMIHAAVRGRLFGATAAVLDRNDDGPAGLLSGSDAIVT